MVIKCIQWNWCRKWTHAFILTWIIILPSVFWAFSIEVRSYISLTIAGQQMQAWFHLQQTLSIEAWVQLCLWVRIKAPTGLDYTMIAYVSRGSNSTFNDVVHDKTNLCTQKKINSHSEGWANWIDFIAIENVLKCKESSSTQSWRC